MLENAQFGYVLLLLLLLFDIRTHRMCIKLTNFATILNASQSHNVNNASGMHANRMHDIFGMFNDQNGEKQNQFLNFGFPFEIFRSSSKQFLEIRSTKRTRIACIYILFYFETYSKCGIQDFNSILRFIWYYIHQVIGLLTNVRQNLVH